MTLEIFGGRLQGLPSGSFNLTCIGQVVFDVLLNQVTLPFVLHGISISQQQHIGLVGRNFKLNGENLDSVSNLKQLRTHSTEEKSSPHPTSTPAHSPDKGNYTWTYGSL